MIRRFWCWLRGGHRPEVQLVQVREPEVVTTRDGDNVTTTLDSGFEREESDHCARCGARMEG